MTDAWDPSIPSHKTLAHEIEFGNGIPEMRPLRQARAALKTVGFEIEHEEDLAERPDPIRWYYPLEGDIWKSQTLWDCIRVWGMSWSGILVTHTAIRLMEYVRVLPKGTFAVVESLKVAAKSLVEGGQTKVRIFYLVWICRADLFLLCSSSRRCTWLSTENPKTELLSAHFIHNTPA